jgi:hypothetical protein
MNNLKVDGAEEVKGVSCAWVAPTGPAEPNAFPHVLRWDRMGRRGQICRIVKLRGPLAQIEFEDGFRTVINRLAVVRGKPRH